MWNATMHSEEESGNLSALDVRPYEEYPLLMPLWGYVASAFVLFLIGFFGFFLNLMVILLMFKDRQLWTPLNMILFNLVCSDFSVSVLGNPFTLVSALFHRWMFGHRMCVIYGFFMSLLGITSITTLTVLAFERYLLVTRPLSPRHLTSRGAALTILFIWTYSMALTTPPLMGWGNYVSEGANISCSVNWQEQSYNTFTYILFLFAMGQTVPCLVIGFSYYNIIHTMKRNSARMGRANRGEAKVTAMVFLMIVAFMVAWTPYSVLALMEQFAQQGMVSPGLAVIPALVAKSSICYNPLIYVGMNTQFRKSIKRVFGIHSKGSAAQMERGVDNTVMSATPGCEARIKPEVAIADSPKVTIKGVNKQVTISEGTSQVNKREKGVCKEKVPSNLATKKSSETGLTPGIVKYNSCENLYRGNEPIRYYGAGLDSKCSTNNQKELDHLKAIYKNHVFEEQGTGKVDEDDTSNEERSRRMYRTRMKHSSSLEMTRVRLESLRKMSCQGNPEDLKVRRIRSLKNSVVSKFMDRRPKDDGENFKTFLFSSDKAESDEVSL